MKKLLSILLTFVMVFSFVGMSASAASNNGSQELGSISIVGVGAKEGNSGRELTADYAIYKLLDLKSYNKADGKYAYKVSDKWTGFFSTAEAAAYVDVDPYGNTSWKTTVAESDENVAAFSKLALNWAKSNNVIPEGSTKDSIGTYALSVDDNKDILKFSDLSLGYYLVDSTVGALCGLTTTNTNAVLNAKNAAPSIDKQVQEDLTGQWGATNSADIGQTVDYRVTVEVHPGAENYVLHDIMNTGLTYKGNVEISHITETQVNPEILSLGTDYTLWTAPGITDDISDDLTDGCTFEIRFTEAICNNFKTNDKIIITYQAMLNRNAVIAGEGNINTAWLEYGEGQETAVDTTTTYTYAVDIVKTDGQYQLIGGAGFKIYDAVTGGNEIKVVLMDDGITYRRARSDEDGIEIEVGSEPGISSRYGQATVYGLDNGTYYIEETTYPVGYNPLTGRQAFTISSSNLEATFIDGIYSTGSGVHVVNKTGTMLPETGGMGTTLFVSLGAIVVLGTGVHLVTKKRMSMIDD